jgi:hypothetical protein
MRVSDGARRRSRNRGWVHVHNDVPAAFNYSTPVRPPANRAPIEVRDAIYRELIRISPATRYRAQIIDGSDGLLLRGISLKQLASYGALPASARERARLARSLRSFARARLPKFANLISIPGFWRDDKGFTQIWKPRNYRQPMLIIPYKDQVGRIQACQLRLHKDDLSPDSPKKYRWLSSPNEPRGCSSGTPIHFSFNPSTAPGADVVITEGALKADTVYCLRPLARVIATSGVSCSHHELIEAARPYNALIGFDADYKTNPAVCMQLATLIAARELDQVNHHLSHTTRVLFWEGHKGIDDAALNNAPMQVISLQQWFRSLSRDAKSEVVKIWRDMEYLTHNIFNGASEHEPHTHINTNRRLSLDRSRDSFDTARPNTSLAG